MLTVTAPRTAAPVVGFNHNVKYAARIYHVQTEDSGLPHAHYITHLFVGGNIVSSIKSTYADKAADPELAKVVRSLMEAQHKLMLRRLIAGEFSDLVGQFAATHYQPGVLATGQTGPAPVNVAPAARQAAPPPALWQPAPPTASPPPAPQARLPGAPLPSTTRLPPTSKTPSTPPRMTPFPPRSIPAPPRPISAPPRMIQAPPRPPVQPQVAARPYAGLIPRTPPAQPPRSAPSLFSDAPFEGLHDDLPTLFAEELISEKSLDEVILAFLSADLEPQK